MASMFTNKLFWAAALTIITMAAAADAANLNFKYSSEIDSKQFGYTNVVIDDAGKVNATTKFSNGKRYDGDHFVTQVIVYGPNNVPLLSMSYGAGINATGGIGSAKEVIVSKVGQLSADMIDDVQWVGVRHLTNDTKDDMKIWEAVKVLFEAILQANSGDGGSQAAAASSARIDGKAVHYRSAASSNKVFSKEEFDLGLLPRASKGLQALRQGGGSRGSMSHRIYQLP